MRRFREIPAIAAEHKGRLAGVGGSPLQTALEHSVVAATPDDRILTQSAAAVMQ